MTPKGLTGRAYDLRDRIGWTPVDDDAAIAARLLDLSKLVVTLAAEVDRLSREVTRLDDLNLRHEGDAS